MGRPQKQGLDYFALDVKMDDDVELIEAQHGLVGFAVLIKLFQKIYSRGYFLEWDKREQLLFSNKVSVDRNAVVSIVSDCITWEIFDENLFEKYGILTSRRIQQQFVSATYKRTGVEIDNRYMLIDVSDKKNLVVSEVSDIGNLETSDVSDIQSTQSKVNKSKVKNSILNNNNYSEIFECYKSHENLVKHRTLTHAMKQSLDKAFKSLNLSQEDAVLIIDRHSKVVELTKKDPQYVVRPRPFYELFGQKAFKADHLICAEYLDDGSKYINYLSEQAVNRSKSNGSSGSNGKAGPGTSSVKGGSKAAAKMNAQIISRDKQYSEEELEDMLLNKKRKGDLENGESD